MRIQTRRYKAPSAREEGTDTPSAAYTNLHLKGKWLQPVVTITCHLSRTPVFLFRSVGKRTPFGITALPEKALRHKGVISLPIFRAEPLQSACRNKAVANLVSSEKKRPLLFLSDVNGTMPHSINPAIGPAVSVPQLTRAPGTARNGNGPRKPSNTPPQKHMNER